MKCVRNAAKRSNDQSYDCLVDCPKSRSSELLLLFCHGEQLQASHTEESADQEDRISEQSLGNVQSRVRRRIILGQSRINTAFAEFCKMCRTPAQLVARSFLKQNSVLGSLAQGASVAPCNFTKNKQLGNILVKLAL